MKQKNAIVQSSLIPDKNATLSNNNPNEVKVHAVVIAGMDENLGVMYILNSWGEGIGNKGYHVFDINFPFREIYYVYEEGEQIPSHLIDSVRVKSSNEWFSIWETSRVDFNKNYEQKNKELNDERIRSQSSRK